MAQDNSNIGDAIRRLTTNPNTPTSDAVVNFLHNAPMGQQTRTGNKYNNPEALAAFNALSKKTRQFSAETAANMAIAKEVTGGDTNLFGATMRIITGLGRGVVNGAYDVMKEANSAWDAAAKGDVLGTIGDVLKTPFDFVGGAIRGVAGSAPGLEGAVQDLTKQPVIENWYELLKSPEFAKSAKNIPALKGLSSDQEMFGKGTWVTPAGLTSTVLDIFLDPTTYATLGIGGALRGASQGIRGVTQAAKVAGKTSEVSAAAKAPFVAKNVYDTRIVKPQVGNALEAMQGGKLSAARYVIRTTGSGFQDAHIRALSHMRNKRAAATAATAGLSAAEHLASEDLQVALDAVNEAALNNVRKYGATAAKNTAEQAQKDAVDVQNQVTKIWNEYPDPVVRQQKLTEARVTAEKEAVKVSNKAIEAKLVAEKAVEGTKKVAPLVTKRKDMWLEQPEEVAKLAREVEASVLNGQVPSLAGLETRLTPKDFAAVKQLIESPLGYREKGAKKLAADAQAGTELIASVTGRKITQGDLRTVQQAITGTKLSRAVTEFVSSKEGLRVMGLISGLSKKVNKPGSALNPTKNLISMQEIENLFRTPQKFETIPPSVLYARLAFLAERAGNTESTEFVALTKYKDRGYNPLTEQGQHPLPSQFAIFGKKSKDQPYFLREVLEAGRVIDQTSYSRELIDTLNSAGVSVIRELEDGHAILRSADEVHEILTGALTKQAIKKAETERKALLKSLQGQYPNLTEANIEATITPDEFAQVQALTNAAPEIDTAKLDRLMAELNPADDQLGKAYKLMQDNGIDWNGRGKAFGVLATGRMAFRDMKQSVTNNLKDMQAAFKTPVYVKGAKKVPLQGSVAFGKMFEAFSKIPDAAKVVEFLAPIAKDTATYTPEEVNIVLSRISSIIDESAKRAVSAENGFAQLFVDRSGTTQVNWVVETGISAYKASAKRESFDKGIFAEIVDRRVQIVARKNKINIANVDKKSNDYQKLVEAVLRDWDGSGRPWDGAGLTTWTAMDVAQETGKSNMRALEAGQRRRLEQDLPAMVDRSIQRVGQFAIKEERININDLTPEFEQNILAGRPGGGNLILDEAEQFALTEAIPSFKYRIVGDSEAAIRELSKSRMFLDSLPANVKAALMPEKGGIIDGKIRASLTDYGREEKALADAIKAGNKDAADYFRQVIMLKKRMSKGFSNQFRRQAIKVIEDLRIKQKIGGRWPSFATAKALKDSISKSGSAAIPHIMMKLMLAESIMTADVAVKAVDRAAARVRTSGVDLRTERTSFDRTLTGYETKAIKATGGKRVDPKSVEVAKATVDDFGPGGQYENNPLMLIAKIRSFEVNGDTVAKDAWGAYIRLLLNTNLPTGEYRSLKEVNAEALAMPENADSLRNLAEALAAAGDSGLLKSIEKGSKPRVVTIQKHLDKLKSGASLSPIELEEMMKPLSVAEELDAVAASDVEELMASMAPDQVLIEDHAIWIETLLRNYANTGRQYISDMAALMSGAIIGRHVVWRGEAVREFRTKLGQILDTNMPEGKLAATDSRKEFAMMRTLEPQATYTGSKPVYRMLSDLAESQGFAAGSAERAAFMRQTYEHVENLAEAQLRRVGIHPAMSVKQATQEAAVLKLYGAESFKELAKTRPAAVRTVYLSTADVKQALPDALSERLFYAGKNESLPETAIGGAVRLAVSLRSELATGKEFTAELNNGLAQTMHELIRAEIKSSTSVTDAAGSKLNFYNLNPELANTKISEFIDAILDPKTLDELVATHIENTAIAAKMGRGKVDNLLKANLEKAYKVFKNPAVGAGNRVEAAIKLFNEVSALTSNHTYSDAFRNIAQYDLHTFLAANMTKDDMNTFLTSLYKQETIDGEAAAIAKVQGKSKKGGSKVGQKALQMEADHFMQAYDNMLGMNLIAKAEKEGELDPNFVAEAYMNNEAGIGQALYAKKWFGSRTANTIDKWSERLFFGYGAEYIMPLINPAKRIVAEQITTKSEYLHRLAQEFKASGIGVKEEMVAFKILQSMPDELLAQAATHHIRVQGAIAGGEKLTVEESRIAASVVDELRPLFAAAGQDVSNGAMLEAVTRMSQIVNELFGGGTHSLIASAGLDPQYLNRAIQEVGGGVNRTGVMFKGKTLEEISNIWREWPQPQVAPLELFRLLHSGLKHAEVLPMSAVTITKKVGVPKSAYASLAEAQAAGLDEIANITYAMAHEKELIYFLDTENYYYPAQLIPEITQAAKTMTETTRLGQGILEVGLRKLDPIQNRAKQFMTTLRPGNWVQNIIGGFTVNFFKGLSNPLRYTQAARMVKNSWIDKKALEDIGLEATKLDQWGARYVRSMNDQGFVIKPSSDPANAKVGVKINGRETTYNEADIMELYKRHGGMVSTTAVFDPIEQAGETLKGVTSNRKTWDRVTVGVGRASANRDDALRLALYLDLMKKQGGKNLDEASRDALREVNRVQPQMQDLSTFSQKYMKRLIMFYTWRAKTMGWLIMETLDRPGYILALQKAQTDMEQSQGLDVRVGDMRPKNVPLRSYMEGNMSQIMPGLGTDEGLWSFSAANPVNDLFGSSGWLSGISANTYEPVQNQVLGWGTKTFKNVFASSDPMIIGLIADWGFNQKTAQGTQFADSPDIAPLLVEDAFNRMGLKPFHTILATALPDVFKRVSWVGKGQSDVSQEAYLEFINYLSGLRIKQVDKPADTKKAIAELIVKVQQAEKWKQGK